LKLKQYMNEVWNQIENFTAFCISFIPRTTNQKGDSLALAASNFRALIIPRVKYEIQMKYRPAIPDNVKNWGVFSDDKEIERFLQVVEEFGYNEIDQDNLNEEVNSKDLLKEITGHKILELKTNQIPKGLVPLERLFQDHDVPLKVSNKENESDVIDVNIGIENEPRIIKLSKALSDEERERYMKLMK